MSVVLYIACLVFTSSQWLSLGRMHLYRTRPLVPCQSIDWKENRIPLLTRTYIANCLSSIAFVKRFDAIWPMSLSTVVNQTWKYAQHAVVFQFASMNNRHNTIQMSKSYRICFMSSVQVISVPKYKWMNSTSTQNSCSSKLKNSFKVQTDGNLTEKLIMRSLAHRMSSAGNSIKSYTRSGVCMSTRFVFKILISIGCDEEIFQAELLPSKGQSKELYRLLFVFSVCQGKRRQRQNHLFRALNSFANTTKRRVPLLAIVDSPLRLNHHLLLPLVSSIRFLIFCIVSNSLLSNRHQCKWEKECDCRWWLCRGEFANMQIWENVICIHKSCEGKKALTLTAIERLATLADAISILNSFEFRQRQQVDATFCWIDANVSFLPLLPHCFNDSNKIEWIMRITNVTLPNSMQLGLQSD